MDNYDKKIYVYFIYMFMILIFVKIKTSNEIFSGYYQVNICILVRHLY